MSRPKKINWEQAKSDYIGTREMSLKALAEKFGVSYSYLRKVSQREGWVKEKEKRWEEAGEDALDKIQDSMSELIIRHAKVGRFLQTVGLASIKKRYEQLIQMEKSGRKIRGLREFEDKILLGFVKVGAGIERAAFPKQLDVRADVRFSTKGLSKAVDKAMYAVFSKNIIKRKPARKGGRGKS